MCEVPRVAAVNKPRYVVAKTNDGEDWEMGVSVYESREHGLLRDNPPRVFLKVYCTDETPHE